MKKITRIILMSVVMIFLCQNFTAQVFPVKDWKYVCIQRTMDGIQQN